MKKEIRTERPVLFAPNMVVAVKAELAGKPENEQLVKAITKAVSMNEALNYKIILDNDGRAFYEMMDEPKFTVEFCEEDWISIIKRNMRKSYRIFDGEMCRFFILRQEDATELLILGHHLAGDGLSFTYLLEDIMNALSGNKLQYKPLEVLDVNDFPSGSKMQWGKRCYLGLMNMKWKAKKEVFGYCDYERMMEKNSEIYDSEIFSDSLNKAELDKVLQTAKNIGVSINSLLTTAFIKVLKRRTNTGLAISLRDKSYKGMSNLVSGIDVLYKYDSNLNFEENAKTVHKLIYNKINNNRKKYFVLRFTDMMDGSLLDSVCMVKYLGYKNKLSEKLFQLMHYDKDKRDIGVSNLTRANIRMEYGDYAIKKITFVPPTVPYGDRIIGIVTHNDTMSITMNTIVNSDYLKEKELFEQAMNEIKSL